MNKDLLKKYIAEVLCEISSHRVPNQLIKKDSKDKKNNTSGSEPEESYEDDDSVDESGMAAGGVVGFTAPLGMSGDDLRKKKKTRKIGWK